MEELLMDNRLTSYEEVDKALVGMASEILVKMVEELPANHPIHNLMLIEHIGAKSATELLLKLDLYFRQKGLYD